MRQVLLYIPRVLAVTLCLATLPACTQEFYEEFSKVNFMDQLTRPRPWGLTDTPDGTPIFQKGWKEGCDSGLGAYGNSRFQTAYGYTQDMTLLDNNEYYRAWKDGFTYCRWYAWGWVRPFQE